MSGTHAPEGPKILVLTLLYNDNSFSVADFFGHSTSNNAFALGDRRIRFLERHESRQCDASVILSVFSARSGVFMPASG